ncbi:MAG: hypothetical protein HRT94_06800 [Alphaproteobacteria bacterium]|nr:hypothetical protein [Alphaproteobacteria bacterium]
MRVLLSVTFILFIALISSGIAYHSWIVGNLEKSVDKKVLMRSTQVIGQKVEELKEAHSLEIQKVKDDSKKELQALYYDYIAEPHKGVLLEQEFKKGYRNKTIAANDSGYILWAAEVIGRALSFGFNDFDQRMEGVRPYFTDQAYAGFLKVIDSSFISKDIVTRNNFVVDTLPNTPAVMMSIRENEAGHVSQIIYEFSVSIGLYSGLKVSSKQARVIVVLNVEDPKKLKIEQLILKQL